MAADVKKKLRIATIVYWILLLYIIAALIWWCYSLYQQSEDMYSLRKEKLLESHAPHSPGYKVELAAIEDLRKRNHTKYIGEGITFLVLILVGAVYLYRSVRRQFRLQQQQQNFVMAITHELKTPIAVSQLNLETLQRHQLDGAKKDKFVQMTLQEMRRLDGLINNILISSQLDGQSYQSTKEDLNLTALVRDVAAAFAMRYPERKLVMELQEEIDCQGDPLLFKLLVSNLLENANKYSPTVKPIQLQLSSQGGEIRLQVKDEGMGIPTEEKRKVFEKFYRIGNEQTRKTKGTGLGLFLCKKIADYHNSNILIEDNQPQGSNFIFSLKA